ncbi:MAG: hypothetical protein GXZ15_02085 [Campylobacter sp.]|nr:hypothetical protein [Campylobacter sp.]
MKWRDQKTSSNVEDKRLQTSTAGINLQALIPLIRWLLGSKFGRIILIIGVIAMFLGYNPLSMVGLSSSSNDYEISAEDEESAQFVGVVLAQTEKVWGQIFANSNARYVEPKLVLFRGAVNSGCGFASSQTGPFYCPADSKVYLDLSFFDELANRHDAPGDFAAAYVVAHEIGHHVQNLLGILDQKEREKIGVSQTKQNIVQVSTELQADCFAGIWAHYTKELLDDGDIEEALNAASMIGDDTLQKKAQGYVVPDSFTHGSAKQRKEAFYRGFNSGQVSSCKF